ncbi:acidic mammalian chitinase-like [Neocloeon triangulifer]|uniref:acidic mammalian chitinase-like n=1 Tax=Neocloeon triangulifer TaxID=2078957 RepID=UPI00286F746E|nr:acidic mammalian chitinase-like [Neocloeon triangulifer]
MHKSTLISFSLLLISISSVTAGKRLVCYFGSWAVYREGANAFNISSIPVNLCTHVIYSFLGLSFDGTIEVLDTYTDEELEGFKKVLALKTLNKNLKVMIAVGGGSFDPGTFSWIVSDNDTINTTVNSLAEFLTVYPFDGIDLDWEFPSSDEDKANFAIFAAALKKRLIKMKPRRILTAAVTADPETAILGYDMKKLVKSLDWVHVMTYDYHYYDDGVTGYNAPLKGGVNDTSIYASVAYWKKNGLPGAKLVLGIPLYAKTFTLEDPTQHDLGAYVTGPGTAGPITLEDGALDYMEVCYFLKKTGWTSVNSTFYQSTYAYKGDQWISYESLDNYIAKVKYAKTMGGAMVWNLAGDDYAGRYCNNGKYPILTLLKKYI